MKIKKSVDREIMKSMVNSLLIERMEVEDKLRTLIKEFMGRDGDVKATIRAKKLAQKITTIDGQIDELRKDMKELPRFIIEV